jgi:spore maturation protein CgeB
LGEFYASSGVVLNDHWETMREYGFLSNRLFDAAACGAIVVSDHVDGMDEVFDGLIYTYSKGSRDLAEKVNTAMAEGNSRQKERARLAEKMRKHHDFEARAGEIDKLLQKSFGMFPRMSSAE